MSVKSADRIAQALKEDALSREELAELIGTSAPIVGRYQRGDMMPSVEIATKISEALGVSLDFLVGKSSLLVKRQKHAGTTRRYCQVPSYQTNRTFLCNWCLTTRL